MDNVGKKISPAILDVVVNEAGRIGLSVDEYILRLMPKAAGELALEPLASDKEFEADMFTLADEAPANESYHGIYSREDIYYEHD